MARKRKKASVFIPTAKRVALVLILAACAYGVYRAGAHMLSTSSEFVVERVRVTGNHYIGTEEIRTAVAVDAESSLSQVDMDSISTSILRNPYIRGVSVSRAYPSTLLVDVQEREPLVYIIDRSVYMVDEVGVILKKLPTMAMGKLPVVTGLSIKDLQENRDPLLKAVELIRKIKEVDPHLQTFISEIFVSKNQYPELFLIRGGARVRLGDENHYERLFLLSQFLNREPVLNDLPGIKKIDLTFQNRIIIQKKS